MAPPKRSRVAAPADSHIAKGDGTVVAHPAFRELPKCLFTLRTAEAMAEYETLARMLFERGRLTLAARRSLSSYAMQFDTITAAAAEGKQVRGSWFTQLDKARKELGLDEIDKPIAAPTSAQANKFAHTGFPARRR